MKALRVIAGLHAGALLPLPPGRYRIDGGEQAASDAGNAFRLYDWTAAALVLVVDALGRLSIVRPSTAGGSATAEEADAWPELQPRRYGEVVLCAGDTERPWPTDAHLLAMLEPSAGAQGRSPLAWIRSWSARGLVVGAGLLVAVGAIYGRSAGSKPDLPPPQPALGAQWLSRSLLSKGLDELEVHQERQDVSLTGLVRNAEQGQAVRAAVADVQRNTGIPVAESWEVADEIASTIESALRVPGLRAHYLGAGRFEVSGTVPAPDQLRSAAPQLQKDLGANVRGIEFLLERISKAPSFSVAVEADGLHYSERPDGAKVFAMKTP